MKNRIIKILTPFLKALYFIYLSKPRKYGYKDLNIVVNPGVFYPGFVKSTSILLDFISNIDLNGKYVLELGAGSGIVALWAAKKGAGVIASDINPLAIENIKQNALRNKIKIVVTHSDLFTCVENKYFDYIFVNPPYYPKNPENVNEMAWYCGSQFEYYEQLFEQLNKRRKTFNVLLMILSEDCNIGQIKQIAFKYNFDLQIVFGKIKSGEQFYIFQIAA